MGKICNTESEKKMIRRCKPPKATRIKRIRDPVTGTFVSVTNDIVKRFRDKHGHYIPLGILTQKTLESSFDAWRYIDSDYEESVARYYLKDSKKPKCRSVKPKCRSVGRGRDSLGRFRKKEVMNNNNMTRLISDEFMIKNASEYCIISRLSSSIMPLVSDPGVSSRKSHINAPNVTSSPVTYSISSKRPLVSNCESNSSRQHINATNVTRQSSSPFSFRSFNSKNPLVLNSESGSLRDPINATNVIKLSCSPVTNNIRSKRPLVSNSESGSYKDHINATNVISHSRSVKNNIRSIGPLVSHSESGLSRDHIIAVNVPRYSSSPVAINTRSEMPKRPLVSDPGAGSSIDHMNAFIVTKHFSAPDETSLSPPHSPVENASVDSLKDHINVANVTIIYTFSL